MNKIYKLQFTTQIQTREDGKKSTHNKVTCILPSAAISDMKLDVENNLVNVSYDPDTKAITIKAI